MGTISYFGWLPTDYGVSHPILTEGVIYFTLSVGDGYLYALDANTGKDKKRFRVKNVALSPPAIAGELVYLGTSDGSVFAIDRNTGEAKWQITRKDYHFDVTAPMVADGLLYFGGAKQVYSNNTRPDGSLHAVDIQTVQERWTFKIKGVPHQPR
jgi:outer membrane protein assembly factor BamB